MPIYVQILLFALGFILFVLVAMYLSGLGMRRICLSIVAELEAARAFNEKTAVAVQDERKNFFRVGTKNLRPQALQVLLQEGIVAKAPSGKYYLRREKLEEIKEKMKS
ncbi:MAG TPA: hypothetical protein PLG80_06635 [Syntrophales bacterium]|nr:hypothetical protein [Syntrophales bacterium]